MEYPTLFWLEVITAFLVGGGSISLLRRRGAARKAAREAGMSVSIGYELAQVTAIYLRSGLVVAYHHKEWCGFGLRYAEDRFIYGGTHDGEILTPTELAACGWNVPGRKEFENLEQFVSWLTPQTNELFAADDRSQPMTRERIVSAVEYCLRTDRNQWPRYAG
jgi:hypothetical protein